MPLVLSRTIGGPSVGMPAAPAAATTTGGGHWTWQ